MDITSLIIEAVSGAVGGNVAGAALKDKSLGATQRRSRIMPLAGHGPSKYPYQRRRGRR